MKRVDVFPAIVRLAPPGSLSAITDLAIRGDAPEGTRKLDRCRVAIVKDLLMIAVDSPGGPQLVFREKVVEKTHQGQVHYALTESGKILAFERDDNCGCGSRLRSWNPFGGIVMSSEDPTS
jgi:hypothetical protein